METKLLNLEKKIGRKQKQYEKHLEEVRLQEEELANQQANLVEVQASADASKDEISGLEDDRAELIQRLAKLSKPNEPAAPSSGDGLQYAQKLANDLMAGMQNFQNESPAVQTVFLQLLSAIEQLRSSQAQVVPPPVGPMQQMLPLLFAKQAAASSINAACKVPSPAPGAGAVTHFDISESTSSPVPHTNGDEVGVSQSVAMEVVGECPGDKRKIDKVLDDGTTEAGKLVQSSPPEPAGAHSSMGTPLSPISGPKETYAPPSRNELRKQLEEKNREKAQERKARTEYMHMRTHPF